MLIANCSAVMGWGRTLAIILVRHISSQRMSRCVASYAGQHIVSQPEDNQ